MLALSLPLSSRPSISAYTHVTTYIHRHTHIYGGTQTGGQTSACRVHSRRELVGRRRWDGRSIVGLKTLLNGRTDRCLCTATYSIRDTYRHTDIQTYKRHAKNLGQADGRCGIAKQTDRQTDRQVGDCHPFIRGITQSLQRFHAKNHSTSGHVKSGGVMRCRLCVCACMCDCVMFVQFSRDTHTHTHTHTAVYLAPVHSSALPTNIPYLISHTHRETDTHHGSQTDRRTATGQQGRQTHPHTSCVTRRHTHTHTHMYTNIIQPSMPCRSLTTHTPWQHPPHPHTDTRRHSHPM